MKKLIALLLTLALCATAALAEPEEETLLDRVASVLPEAADMEELFVEEELSDVMGIEPEEYEQALYLADSDAMSGRELLLILALEDTVESVAERVEAYRLRREKETVSYNPAAYKLIHKAEVVTQGNAVILITVENSKDAVDAVLTLFAPVE